MMRLRSASVLAAGLWVGLAHAQWIWLDAQGKKVFSDRPPTIEVPDKNILRRPGNAPLPMETSPVPAGAKPTQIAKPAGKDAELEKKKSQAEAAEAAKKKADEDKQAAVRADNCDRARKAIGMFQSGTRISVVNANGEREFISDETRAAELQRLQGIAQTDCASP